MTDIYQRPNGNYVIYVYGRYWEYVVDSYGVVFGGRYDDLPEDVVRLVPETDAEAVQEHLTSRMNHASAERDKARKKAVDLADYAALLNRDIDELRTERDALREKFTSRYVLDLQEESERLFDRVKASEAEVTNIKLQRDEWRQKYDIIQGQYERALRNAENLEVDRDELRAENKRLANAVEEYIALLSENDRLQEVHEQLKAQNQFITELEALAAFQSLPLPVRMWAAADDWETEDNTTADHDKLVNDIADTLRVMGCTNPHPENLTWVDWAHVLLERFDIERKGDA